MSLCKGMPWVLATLLLAASASAVSVRDNLVVAVRIIDNGKNEKRLVDQTVEVSDDGTLSFYSGGEFSGSNDTPPLEFGTRIAGRLIDSGGRASKLALKVEFSSRFDSGDSNTPVVCKESVALIANLKLGETVRVSVGKNRWCELKVDSP